MNRRPKKLYLSHIYYIFHWQCTCTSSVWQQIIWRVILSFPYTFLYIINLQFKFFSNIHVIHQSVKAEKKFFSFSCTTLLCQMMPRWMVLWHNYFKEVIHQSVYFSLSVVPGTRCWNSGLQVGLSPCLMLLRNTCTVISCICQHMHIFLPCQRINHYAEILK